MLKKSKLDSSTDCGFPFAVSARLIGVQPIKVCAWDKLEFDCKRERTPKCLHEQKPLLLLQHSLPIICVNDGCNPELDFSDGVGDSWMPLKRWSDKIKYGFPCIGEANFICNYKYFNVGFQD